MRRDVQEIFRSTPHEKQVMMFSATLSKDIRPVCKKFMQDVCSSSRLTCLVSPSSKSISAFPTQLISRPALRVVWKNNDKTETYKIPLGFIEMAWKKYSAFQQDLYYARQMPDTSFSYKIRNLFLHWVGGGISLGERRKKIERKQWRMKRVSVVIN